MSDGTARRAPLTVQGWFYAVLAVMVLLVALGSVVGAELLHRTTVASDRLIQQLQPARAEAFRLQSAIVDQETGERGYALTADREFLAPYTEGRELESRSAARMRRLLKDEPALLAGVDRVQAAAARWRREVADLVVAGVTPGQPRPLDRRAAIAAKTSFDELRTLFDRQNAALGKARDDRLAELRHVRTLRNVVFSGMVVVFVLTGVLMLLLVRTLVIRPLETLRTSTRRIAEGHFDHPIAETGPADIRGVAHDVDSMRRRIMEELGASREQEQLLVRQAADLDAQALELRRSNAELEQFAYVASHDLQEPLRKVASFCQLLEKRYGDVLDERGKQYVDFAVDGAKRMQVLITDLLTFSRVGRVNDARVPVPLDAVLDKALGNLGTSLEESGADISRPERLPEIAGDPTLLEMLWQNLVGNAVKFRAPDRPPRVAITCELDEAAGEWSLAVADNGIGIPPEFAEKVFVIFQRLHSREAYAGTGIGLALCHKIVEHHGGRIWVDTQHAPGARICFTLPAAPAGPSDRGLAPASDPASRQGPIPPSDPASALSEGSTP